MKILDHTRFSTPETTFGPILITTSLGMTEGFSAILLPQLNATSLHIDEEMSSWIASMAALPMALGCILGGILMEKIGRKGYTYAYLCALCVWDGWILCGASGASDGGVYMSETSEPKYRGFLLAAISFAIALGLFLSHLIGTFISWQNTALACCSFPHHLHHLHDFRSRIAHMKKRKNFLEIIKDLQKPEFTKPLVIIVIFFITCQWAGLNAITFYSVSIIQLTLGGTFDEYLAMLIIDTIRVFMSIFACILLKKLGRRPLAIISGTGTFVSLFILSSFTFAVKFYPGISAYTFVPLISLITYVAFITVGFVPLPWTMMGEVFPLANRGMGSGISALSAYVAFFSVVKTTPSMFGRFGPEGSFFIYGMLALVGTIILILFLPETKDKPLYQIEDNFKRKK
ncbi:hypothetical protein Zmor_017988 [Zophobas morio]|uniref:Major facilitator superfamily (MFS) profile domain-containing protein n=1 Tax=Zophobas morio TaxID=2755281 RepID=A0AA38ICG0_9CUCU|nr:hypothetical protein Zmor_017988 [Zophobas morio]